MMNLQHRVQINIADRSGQKKQVLGSKKVRLPQRLLNNTSFHLPDFRNSFLSFYLLGLHPQHMEVKLEL